MTGLKRFFYVIFGFNVLLMFLACQESSAENLSEPVFGEKSTSIEGNPLVIFQDSEGNHWFGGSEAGVYRYDGKKLTLFTTKDGLCSTSLLGIQEDHKGDLFFDTQDGVCMFDGSRFTTLDVVEGTNEWKLEANDLWFRCGWDHDGPFRYDGKQLYALQFPETDRANAFHIRHPNVPYSPYGLYTTYSDSDGNIWFGTASLGACRFDGTTLSWMYEEQMIFPPNGGDFGLRSIIEDADGHFWFCNSRYRYELLPSDQDTSINYVHKHGIGDSTILSDDPYFLTMTLGKNNDLWMATYDNGVWHYDGETFEHYPIQRDGVNLFLFTIYSDRDGVIWLGTQNGGIYRKEGDAFARFTP